MAFLYDKRMYATLPDYNSALPLPRMVNIPPGRFLMGGLDERDDVEGGCTLNERPPRYVYIAAFALGRYPVTFEEYDAFCEANGFPLPDDHGWGRGKHPVINVSWDDAQAYCRWLSALNGGHYRLPSEAEWEYATRGGTNAAYPWGMQATAQHANHAMQHGMTTPVGTYPANAFGLHDVCGNVWEWVQDCWHDSYHGAPVNAQAWEEVGNHHERVLRGGSWNDRPRYLRAAYRVKDYPSGRQIFRGFRVAR
ncbi:formylglycine-generating enzyme family protein [Thiothrix subterranea]|uniref:formylglycine-generating enzyme family protein n=1 Tax=Thiothrix subterranea TaxID=2735563 RepID=UPI00192CE1A0|nr:formylglycine-generating enzyme family protein [Thiothrix subterranea]QQZ28079.1 formylglycine-generating enzyme family protein [Thiothrix subterranea]